MIRSSYGASVVATLSGSKLRWPEGSLDPAETATQLHPSRALGFSKPEERDAPVTSSASSRATALHHKRLPLLAMGYAVSCVDCSRYREGDELGKALAYLCGLPLAMLCYSFVVSARRLHPPRVSSSSPDDGQSALM